MLSFIWQIATLLLFTFIPLSFVCVSFGFVFWGYPIRHMLLSIGKFTLIHGFYYALFFQFIPTYLSILNYVISFFVIFMWMFRAFRLIDRLKIGLTVIIFTVLLNGLFSFLVLFFERQSAMETSSLWGMLVWPICAIMIFGIYQMDHRRIHAGTYVMSAIKKWNIWHLVVFLLIQIGLIIILFFMVYQLTLDNKMLFHSLLISGLAISIMMILSAIYMIGKAKEEAIKNSQEYYIDDVNKLFTIIRGQRHDFLNHVQVIHSMLQRKMLTNLEDYIQELVGEITHINEMMQIGHPALAALIQAKTYTADQRKIKFTISLEHMEALNLDMKSIDIVKIIGNLLDNAFEEVQLLDDLERWVELKGKVDSGVLTICVSNSGRVLSEEEKSLVYYPGYTTKHGTTHSGIGLSIVKERVDHYKGSLELDSNVMDGTSFRIQIPLTNTQSS